MYQAQAVGYQKGEAMPKGKTTKPPIVKAKQAGNCVNCGGVFFVGDKIRLVQLYSRIEVNQQVAVHAECWHP